jgi:hypothetical protein
MLRTEPSRSSGSRGPKGFALHLPVWYRLGDDIRWRVGVTERISECEVVIRAQQPIPSVRSVTLVVCLPSAGSACGGCLVARGQIKRTSARPGRNGRAGFAISVRQSRLEPVERVFHEEAA